MALTPRSDSHGPRRRTLATLGLTLAFLLGFGSQVSAQGAAPDASPGAPGRGAVVRDDSRGVARS
ncbi:hypothetical protein, partial [Methyloceanibacter marginalis]|uniref:hypothetical protein n=1 Tax=Methyloceanibacter marginalis TaxID=1774971 RepID=UPI001959FF7B